MNKKYIWMFFITIFYFSLKSAPIEFWFEQANNAYSKGQFDTAVFYYEKIIEAGVENSAVYYNYGNALFRLKKIGRARVAYEKAAVLAPLDNDIQANLKFVKANITDKIPEPERGFMEYILWRLHVLFPLNFQLLLAFIMWTIIIFFITMTFFVSHNLRLWLIYSSVLLGIIFGGLGISIGFKIYEAEKVSYAVLVVPLVDAKNEPE
ncbi:MAG: tetratricopeptide repeat protein, partial [Chitinispirillaceae bacterium]|nr:tetratricopeptide repeat protein [Chitinispirillaceae bacterium]